MLLAREAADSQSLRNEPFRNGVRSAVKGCIEFIVEYYSAEAHHGKLRGNRSIRFDIDDNVAHWFLWLVARNDFQSQRDCASKPRVACPPKCFLDRRSAFGEG